MSAYSQDTTPSVRLIEHGVSLSRRSASKPVPRWRCCDSSADKGLCLAGSDQASDDVSSQDDTDYSDDSDDEDEGEFALPGVGAGGLMPAHRPAVALDPNRDILASKSSGALSEVRAEASMSVREALRAGKSVTEDIPDYSDGLPPPTACPWGDLLCCVDLVAFEIHCAHNPACCCLLKFQVWKCGPALQNGTKCNLSIRGTSGTFLSSRSCLIEKIFVLMEAMLVVMEYPEPVAIRCPFRALKSCANTLVTAYEQMNTLRCPTRFHRRFSAVQKRSWKKN